MKEAYKVTNVSGYGHEIDTSYYFFRESAHEEFERRLKELHSDKEIGEIKVFQPSPNELHIIKKATYEVGVSFMTDCGMEYDVDHYDLLIQQITINE